MPYNERGLKEIRNKRLAAAKKTLMAEFVRQEEAETAER
jgi:hypothetical protein